MAALSRGECQIIAQIVNRQHVGVTPRQLIRAVYERMNAHGRTREARRTRHACYQYAMQVHRDNVELYIRVQNGMYGPGPDTGTCDKCGAEHPAEPDAEFTCHECHEGTVRGYMAEVERSL